MCDSFFCFTYTTLTCIPTVKRNKGPTPQPLPMNFPSCSFKITKEQMKKLLQKLMNPPHIMASIMAQSQSTSEGLDSISLIFPFQFQT